MFEQLDENNDGQLDIYVVKPYIKNWIDEDLGIEDGTTIIEESFNEMDKNGNLWISKEEMFNHIKETLDMTE